MVAVGGFDALPAMTLQPAFTAPELAVGCAGVVTGSRTAVRRSTTRGLTPRFKTQMSSRILCGRSKQVSHSRRGNASKLLLLSGAAVVKNCDAGAAGVGASVSKPCGVSYLQISAFRADTRNDTMR